MRHDLGFVCFRSASPPRSALGEGRMATASLKEAIAAAEAGFRLLKQPRIEGETHEPSGIRLADGTTLLHRAGAIRDEATTTRTLILNRRAAASGGPSRTSKPFIATFDVTVDTRMIQPWDPNPEDPVPAITALAGLISSAMAQARHAVSEADPEIRRAAVALMRDLAARRNMAFAPAEDIQAEGWAVGASAITLERVTVEDALWASVATRRGAPAGLPATTLIQCDPAPLGISIEIAPIVHGAFMTEIDAVEELRLAAALSSVLSKAAA